MWVNGIFSVEQSLSGLFSHPFLKNVGLKLYKIAKSLYIQVLNFFAVQRTIEQFLYRDFKIQEKVRLMRITATLFVFLEVAAPIYQYSTKQQLSK